MKEDNKKRTSSVTKTKAVQIDNSTIKNESTETTEILAIRLYPSNPRKALVLFRQLSDHFDKAGDIQKSKAILNKAATMVADEGWKWKKEGDFVKAQAKAQKALEIYSAHVDAKNLLGLIYIDRFELVDAQDIFEKAIDDAIDEQNGAIQLANLSYWNDLATRPYMRARHGLTFCLCYQGKHKEALEQCLFLLRLDPQDNMGVTFLLGDLYHYVGDLEQAERFYKRYISLQRVYLGYSLLLYGLGREHEARVILKKASNASLRTRSMLEDYLHCFVLWEAMGSYKWGQYPSQELHANALLTSWNQAIASIDDEKAYSQASEAYNFCKLCGPLWLVHLDSYVFLKEGRPGG